MEYEDKIMTTLTLWCTFLMGYIDTYSFMNYSHLLVSAQTGNLVLLGANLAHGFEEIMPHVTSFLGFLIGVFSAQVLVEALSQTRTPKYTFLTFIQVIVLFFVAFFETYINIYGFALILGAFSGYNLTMFKKVGSTQINNGVMTGNVQKFIINSYLAFFKKSTEAKEASKIIFIGIIMFIIGIFTASLFYHYLNFPMMLSVAILALIVHVWLIFINRNILI